VSDVLIARQPIFDAGNQLAAYEMLYRPAGSAGGAVPATSHALIAGLLTMGLDQLVGDARAFVPFSHALLLDHAFDLLDPSRVAVELLDPLPRDADAVAAITALRARGFPLVVGDFAMHADHRDLLACATIVRLDLTRHVPDDLPVLARGLRRANLQLLAYQVPTLDSADRCRALGFTLFQGQAFSRPQIVKRRDLPAGMTGVARLMNMVLDPRATDAELEAAFRADPGLSLKLLRIVNSAALGGKGIESIQHAIRLIGRTPLHRWLSLLFAESVPHTTGVERELVVAALARARLCELIALNSGRGHSAPPIFLTGLLSGFDAILCLPMRELLHQVRVAPEVESALLHQDGPYTPYLNLAVLYGDGRWDEALVLAAELGVEDDLPIWYTQAGGWARNIFAQ
jgi:c-di-GMP phosphodiesterase